MSPDFAPSCTKSAQRPFTMIFSIVLLALALDHDRRRRAGGCISRPDAHVDAVVIAPGADFNPVPLAREELRRQPLELPPVNPVEVDDVVGLVNATSSRWGWSSSPSARQPPNAW